MNIRQENILVHIVEDYIATACPVGSDYLVKKMELDVSGATVRNDCQLLEKEGYLTHPHTSAGRIPTEVGYKKFVDLRFKIEDLRLKNNNLIKKETQELEDTFNETLKQAQGDSAREAVKNLAKALAELSQAAVLVGFGKRDVYYTGLSYLFSQPEFEDHDLVYNISSVVDHLDEVFPDVYESFDESVSIRIGSDNLFARECSFIGTRIDSSENLIGVLGPIRMDYIGNTERLEYIKNLLSK